MRDILVHATQFESWSGSVQYAALLAAYLKASLTALYCIEAASTNWAGGLGAAALVPTVDPTHERIQTALAVEEAFGAYAGSLGVCHSDWVVHDGDPTRGLAHLRHWHDLLVLGRGSSSPWESDTALADILMASHLPCIVVPGLPELRPLRPLRIAVAWDGSLQAVRALHAAVPLLERARQVVLLMGGGCGPLHLQPGLPAFDLDRYCERHDLKVQRVVLDEEEDAGEGAVLDAALAAHAELLVMGAFGHTRLRERIFGGTTQHVLRHSPIPVLLRH